MFLVLILFVLVATSREECQSGLREDNTNYIYCARQNLTHIFDISYESTSSVNVLYDELVLTDNLIESIDSFGNIKARKLYLELNPIRHIHPNSLDLIRNYLEEVYFEYKAAVENQLALSKLMFESSVLQKCSNLRILSIKKFQFNSLDRFQFRKLTRLEILTLNGNSVASVDRDAFVGLENTLVELDLASNLLEEIPSEALGVLRRLRKLNLSQNRIRAIQDNCFFSFKSLQILDISYNYLQSIQENSFNGQIQNNLKVLNVQNNELKWHQFIHLLFNLHHLTELNIDFNKLGYSVADNNESALNHSDVIELKLASLSIQGNSLTRKTLELFVKEYSYSGISQLSKRFLYPNLTRINLARNKIKSLPADMFTRLGMINLKELYLDRNPLEFTIENTFNGLYQNLKLLSLNSLNPASGQNITNLFGSINRLSNLQNLKLNNNNLGQFDERVQLNVNSLRWLEMQNNNLGPAPPRYLCNMRDSLNSLDLSSNRLETFNLSCMFFVKSNSTYKLTQLSQLNLNNNNLVCDCHLRALKVWLNVNSEVKDLLEFIKWKCAAPGRLVDKYLNSVDIYELRCETNEQITTTTETTSILTTRKPITYSRKYTEVKVSYITSTPQPESYRVPSAYISSKNELYYYYSFFVGVSLGVSVICLVFLVLLYTSCVGKLSRRDEDKVNFRTSNFINDYVSSSHRNELLFATPMSATTTVSTAIHSKSVASNFSNQIYDPPLLWSESNNPAVACHVYHEISNDSYLDYYMNEENRPIDRFTQSVTTPNVFQTDEFTYFNNLDDSLIV